jgi:hypothetical protein
MAIELEIETKFSTPNEYVLSTECSCTYLDENGDEQPLLDHCFAGCYSDALELLQHELSKWERANGYNDDTVIRVQAEAIGWQRRAGYLDTAAENVAECLKINGDFRITYHLTADYKTLTARRSSHDEPTGTGLITFTKSPLDNCDYCGDIGECSQYDDGLICQHCKEWRGIE